MTNPSDPVHPTIIDLNPTGHLSKREYFAASAMQGLCASDSGVDDHWTFEEIAKYAVRQADALIAELNKEPK